jgi:hypothetical protein
MLFTVALSVLLQVVLVTRGAFAVEGAIRSGCAGQTTAVC